MQTMGEKCAFEFNFDPATFKVGDVVSYRVLGSSYGDFPFVGTLVEVHDDHVVIAAEPNDPSVKYRATRESRTVVSDAALLRTGRRAERRVGKALVRTGRTPWVPYNSKKE